MKIIKKYAPKRPQKSEPWTVVRFLAGKMLSKIDPRFKSRLEYREITQTQLLNLGSVQKIRLMHIHGGPKCREFEYEMTTAWQSAQGLGGPRLLRHQWSINEKEYENFVRGFENKNIPPVHKTCHSLYSMSCPFEIEYYEFSDNRILDGFEYLVDVKYEEGKTTLEEVEDAVKGIFMDSQNVSAIVKYDDVNIAVRIRSISTESRKLASLEK